MNTTCALILAYGQDPQSSVLCRDRPQSVLPFAGRYRSIDFMLSHCIYSGVDDVVLLVDSNHAQLYASTTQQYSDISKTHIHLYPLEAACVKGTADAVYQGINSVVNDACGTVMVLLADHICLTNYQQLLTQHKQRNALLTVGVNISTAHDVMESPFVVVSDSGIIKSFYYQDKPREGTGTIPSMGIYAFNRQALTDYIGLDYTDPFSSQDFERDIIPKMIASEEAYAYKFDTYHWHVTSVESYYRANLDMIHCFSSTNSLGECLISPKEANLGLPRVGEEGCVRRSIISPGCEIHGEVENSVLSPNILVSENAIVRNSIVMSNVSIGPGSIVDHCIVEEGATISDSCYIGYGAKLFPIRSNITILGNNAHIESHTMIGCGQRVLDTDMMADLDLNTIISDIRQIDK